MLPHRLPAVLGVALSDLATVEDTVVGQHLRERRNRLELLVALQHLQPDLDCFFPAHTTRRGWGVFLSGYLPLYHFSI